MSATMHENLIATMAVRAAQMEAIGCFTLPHGSAGEDHIANFCADKVREYEISNTDEPFDLFIEAALREHFGERQEMPEQRKRPREREER